MVEKKLEEIAVKLMARDVKIYVDVGR